jgi:hypothetical protein
MQRTLESRAFSSAILIMAIGMIDEDFPEAPRHFGDYRQRERTVSSDHESQSERDWAFAKRALTRGDDLEVAIQSISNYCADDKADPN